MQRVFDIFEEILRIPRPSGKEEKIANYIVEFAKKNNLEYKKDKYNNVFLKKNNNSDKTIILQAHSDMVCVANGDYDFDNKGIDFYIDGDYYKAKNTSLGADDGIGVAIILSLLEEENMPNIEAMITTQEETTMLGAMNFDYSLLTGKTLISLDGISEADIESSSAGMCSITLNKKITKQQKHLNYYKLTISNLRGGHSGDDISKNRANAIKLAFDILNKINIHEICDFKFGEKDNVIPNEGIITFSSDKEISELRNLINNIDLRLSSDDKDLKLEIEENKEIDIIKESEDIINFINNLADGLLETFDDGFPLLSSNIGAININDNEIIIKLSIRSSDVDLENQQLEKLENLCNKYNFNVKIEARKPFFAYLPESRIRDLLACAYKNLYSKETTTRKIHACMEGGIISNNIEGLDIVTIAPTINDCHTINEKVSISSIKRVYEWLKETLRLYKDSDIERTEIYRKAIIKARELMREKTKENKAPAWKLTELTQKVGKDLAKEFNVDANIVLLTLYLQHLIFEPTVGGEIQKNHPDLSAKYVEDTNILEKWNIPEEDRVVILEAIRVHHNKNINSNLTVEVIKNAECQKFVTIEGALIWLHELGIRENDYESSKELVFYKMNQKKELLTLEKCIERGENSCNKIKSMFEDKNIIPQLKKLHKLGLDKVPYEDAIKKIDFKFDL